MRAARRRRPPGHPGARLGRGVRRSRAAHLIALGIIGGRRRAYRGEIVPAADALHRAGIAPLVLEAKEGLTLLNGTQHMTSVGGLTVHDADATRDRRRRRGCAHSRRSRAPARVRRARDRPLARIQDSSRSRWLLRDLLADRSRGVAQGLHCGKVQDQRSLRCMPRSTCRRDVDSRAPCSSAKAAARQTTRSCCGYGRDDLGQQLPRPAGRARARCGGDGDRKGSAEHQRAPRRAARQPAPVERARRSPAPDWRLNSRLRRSAQGHRGGARLREQDLATRPRSTRSRRARAKRIMSRWARPPRSSWPDPRSRADRADRDYCAPRSPRLRRRDHDRPLKAGSLPRSARGCRR